jgi:ribosomal protein S18 acetylase RimI-like enzyme
MASKEKLANLAVRDATSAEFDQVGMLLRDAYEEYKEFIPHEAWESYLEDIMNVRSRANMADLIVAELGQKLVGTVTLYLNASESLREMWPENWAGIRLLAVHPEFRGNGIGRALMEECLRRCREHGVHTIGLHTSEIMNVARHMYERMGFKRAPEFDFFPQPHTIVLAYRLDL